MYCFLYVVALGTGRWTFILWCIVLPLVLLLFVVVAVDGYELKPDTCVSSNQSTMSPVFCCFVVLLLVGRGVVTMIYICMYMKAGVTFQV